MTIKVQTNPAESESRKPRTETSFPAPLIGPKSLFAAALSLALGIGLLAFLFRFTGLHSAELTALLRAADKRAFILLCCLFAFNSFLSGEKWRLVHRSMRDPNDRSLPLSTAFSLTTLGVALGQLLPIQVSASIARTLGTWAEGRAFRHGTVATLFEQSFDFLVLSTLMLATLATRLFHRQAVVWIACSVCILLVTIAVAPLVTGAIRWTASFIVDKATGRYRQFASELLASGLIDKTLVRQLTAISAIRFVVLALMAESVSLAIHSPIPMWHLAAAVPFGLLAALAGITPGGLGLTEFAFTGILAGLGTSAAASSEWAIANRLLTCAAAFVVATAGAAILSIQHAKQKDPAPELG